MSIHPIFDRGECFSVKLGEHIMVYKRIGDVLVAGGYLTEEQLQDALAIQKKSGGKKLGDVLIDSQFISQ